MRFIVFGAGAIGGVIGARLFQAGQDVVLIARGPHYEAIRRQGLRLESPDGAVTLPIPVVANPAEVNWGIEDRVLLAMKSQDTADAVLALAAAADPATPVLCVQNGVENERIALRHFANVYGVCVMCPTTHVEPGVAQANSSPITGLLDIGRYPWGVDASAHELAAVLRGATFSSEVLADILRWKYTKLLNNLGNAVEAVCGPAARSGVIQQRARREGIACLEAAGIDFATDEEDTTRRGSLLRLRPIDGKDRGGGSSWQSLTRAAGSIETDFLSGEIVLLGRLWGIPTPVNSTLQVCAARLARDRTAPGAISEEDFLRLVESNL